MSGNEFFNISASVLNNIVVVFAGTSDTSSVVNLDVADTQSIGPDGSEDPESGGGYTNTAFSSHDYDMMRNPDPVPKHEVPIDIQQKLEPQMDGNTIGPMASLGEDDERFVSVHSVAMPGNHTGSDSGSESQANQGSDNKSEKVNFRHAQFRGLNLSNPSAGRSSYM